MKINTYITILDRLEQELKHRLNAYTDVESNFGFLNRLKIIDDADIQKFSKHLQSIYYEDLDESFAEECVQFKYFTENFDEVKNIKELLSFIRDKNVITMFPNIEIAARILLSLPITNATGERSFLTLKRTKNHLRNSVSQEGITNLALTSWFLVNL